MRSFKLIVGFIFLSFLFIDNSYSQNEIPKTDWDTLIVGKWVQKIILFKDGKEYLGKKCNDTIQYFLNGSYSWQQCDWNETGNWKFSDKKDFITHYNIDNKYWKAKLKTDDLGEAQSIIFSISETELVTLTYAEMEGEIRCFYKRLD